MTSTTEIYTLSLHDALPISAGDSVSVTNFENLNAGAMTTALTVTGSSTAKDRKSTRLNSSHLGISYDVYHRDLHSFPTRRSSDLGGRFRQRHEFRKSQRRRDDDGADRHGIVHRQRSEEHTSELQSLRHLV